MEWFPWYPALYRSDTMHLTLAEDGAYRRLIDEYMVTRSPLPDNDAALARIIGISVNDFPAIAAQIRGFFSAKNGYLRHKRCDIELDRQDGLSAKRSQIAANAAAKRRALSKASKQLPGKKLLQDRTGQDRTEKKEVEAAQARPLPADWQPRGEDISVGLNDCKYTLVEIEKLADGFRDHWRSNGKRKKDWDAAFRNWQKSSIATNDVAAWRKLSGNGQGAGGFIAALAELSQLEEQDIPGPDDYDIDGRVETDAGYNGGGEGKSNGTGGGVLGASAGKGRGS